MSIHNNPPKQTNEIISINQPESPHPEKPQIQDGKVIWGDKIYVIMYGDDEAATHGQKENIEKIVLATLGFLGDKLDPRSLSQMNIDPSQVEYQHTHQQEVVSEKFTGQLANEMKDLFKKVTENLVDKAPPNIEIEEKKLEEQLQNVSEQKTPSLYDVLDSIGDSLKEIDNTPLTLKPDEHLDNVKDFIDQAGINKVSYDKKTGEFSIIDRNDEPLHDRVGNSRESRKAVEKLLAMADDAIDKLKGDFKIGKNFEGIEKELTAIKDFLNSLKKNTQSSWVSKVIENQKSVKLIFDQVDRKAQSLMESLHFIEKKATPHGEISLTHDNHGLAELGRWLDDCPGEFQLNQGKLENPSVEQKPNQFNYEKHFAQTLGKITSYIQTVKENNPSQDIQENLNKITKSLSENPKIYLLLKKPEHKHLENELEKILPEERYFKKIKTTGVEVQIKEIKSKVKKLKNKTVNLSAQSMFDEDHPIRKKLTLDDIQQHKKELDLLKEDIRPISKKIGEIQLQNSFYDEKKSTPETKNIKLINDLKIQLLQEEQLNPLLAKRRNLAEEIISTQNLPNLTIKSDLRLSELIVIGNVTDTIGGEAVINQKDTTGISSSFNDVINSEGLFQKQMVVFQKMINEIGPKQGKKEALELLDKIIKSSEFFLERIGNPPSLKGMLQAFNPESMQRTINNFIDFSNNAYLNQKFSESGVKNFIKKNIKDYQDVAIDLNSLKLAPIQRGLRYPMMFKDGLKKQLDRYEIKKSEGENGYDKDLTPFHEPINQIEQSLGLLGALFDSLKK